ncbi:hypothetical protein CerSpe_031440 [Prunus speciosa]
MEDILQIKQKEEFGKYLGITADFCASKKKVFEDVRNKVSTRLTGWAEQYLSMAGKEVLLKVVAMALPNHAMSCFKLPVGLCKELERECANYRWKGC